VRLPRWSRAPFGIAALGVDGEYTVRMLLSDLMRPVRPLVVVAYWLDDPRRRRRRIRFGEQLHDADLN
jgi:hypothetical protein